MASGASEDRVHAGQAISSPTTLAVYDVVVLGVSNPLIWRCPTRRILDLYNRCVSDDHLDVGVGTGWYLDRCRFPSASPRIGLMDLNPSSLAAASRRIARYRPTSVQADVLQPVAVPEAPFRSIALTYLLHCLPGPIEDKAIAFDHLAPLLDSDGVVFGATILSQGVDRSAIAKALMRTYNAKGVFSNTEDSASSLDAALKQRFATVTIDIVGCVALFSARGYKARRSG